MKLTWLVILWMSCCLMNAQAPQIKFEAISSLNPIAFTQAIEITITYEDPDGDLGINMADSFNLFILDSRADILYKMRIRKLLPDHLNGSISGTIIAEIPYVPILNESSAKEEVRYSITVKDRSGNISNKIFTPIITVTRKKE